MSRITKVTAVAGDEPKTVEQLIAPHPLVDHPKGHDSRYKARVDRRKKNGQPNFLQQQVETPSAVMKGYQWYRTFVILRLERVPGQGDKKVLKFLHLKSEMTGNDDIYLPHFHSAGVANSEIGRAAAFICDQLNITAYGFEIVGDVIKYGEDGEVQVTAMLGMNFGGRVSSTRRVKIGDEFFVLGFEPLTKELVARLHYVAEFDVLRAVVHHLGKMPDYAKHVRGFKTAIDAAKKSLLKALSAGIPVEGGVRMG